MEDEKLNMDTRILAYNEHYGFIENPQEFNFDFNPHRLIVKNYALRTADKATYNKYLDSFFPEKTEFELKNFDVDLKGIRQYDNKAVLEWLVSNEIKVVESDINCDDPDAIFKMVHVPDSEDPIMYVFEDEDFILNRMLTRDFLKMPNKMWINIKKPLF